eukprot:6460131-Alexandrium_andersonii.AAC.1
MAEEASAAPSAPPASEETVRRRLSFGDDVLFSAKMAVAKSQPKCSPRRVPWSPLFWSWATRQRRLTLRIPR